MTTLVSNGTFAQTVGRRSTNTNVYCGQHQPGRSEYARRVRGPGQERARSLHVPVTAPRRMKSQVIDMSHVYQEVEEKSTVKKIDSGAQVHL